MGDLIDRLSGHGERPKLPVHQFVSGYRLYAAGVLTRTQIAEHWDLQDDEIIQATLIADRVDTMSPATNKTIYVLKVEAVSMWIERPPSPYHNPDGTINKALVAQHLEL
jgi:hypothetical protein